MADPAPAAAPQVPGGGAQIVLNLQEIGDLQANEADLQQQLVASQANALNLQQQLDAANALNLQQHVTAANVGNLQQQLANLQQQINAAQPIMPLINRAFAIRLPAPVIAPGQNAAQVKIATHNNNMGTVLPQHAASARAAVLGILNGWLDAVAQVALASLPNPPAAGGYYSEPEFQTAVVNSITARYPQIAGVIVQEEHHFQHGGDRFSDIMVIVSHIDYPCFPIIVNIELKWVPFRSFTAPPAGNNIPVFTLTVQTSANNIQHARFAGTQGCGISTMQPFVDSGLNNQTQLCTNAQVNNNLHRSVFGITIQPLQAVIVGFERAQVAAGVAPNLDYFLQIRQ